MARVQGYYVARLYGSSGERPRYVRDDSKINNRKYTGEVWNAKQFTSLSAARAVANRYAALTACTMEIVDYLAAEDTVLYSTAPGWKNPPINPTIVSA